MKILIFSFLSILAFNSFSQIKLKSEAPLIDKSMLNTQGDSLSLQEIKKENGFIVIFSCNTCPFVVGTPDFPGWEKQYNEL